MSVLGTYILGGVSLDNPNGRWWLSDATLPRPIPTARAVAVQVPGRHGVLPIPAATFEPGLVTLGVTVSDANEAGVPSGHEQLLANVDYLSRLLGSHTGMLRLQFVPPSNEVDQGREADVQLVATVAPTLHDPLTMGLVFPLQIPGVFWRDPTEHEISIASFVTSWSPTATELNGTTAPIVDAVFRAAGPLTQLRVTDTNGQSYIEWNGSLPSGSYLRVDTDALTAHTTTVDTWTGGVDVSGGLTTGPEPFQITPSIPGTARWTMRRVGGAGAGAARVRRSFL